MGVNPAFFGIGQAKKPERYRQGRQMANVNLFEMLASCDALQAIWRLAGWLTGTGYRVR
jgi:hypothetical protein